jgi:hypothetical protein
MEKASVSFTAVCACVLEEPAEISYKLREINGRRTSFITKAAR